MINVSINCQSTLRLIIHSKGSEEIFKQGFFITKLYKNIGELLLKRK